MQDITPKQTKLFGDTVRGVGVVVAVSSRLACCYALIEDIAGTTYYSIVFWRI